ncbi:uncharacterized protein LOC132039409 [Lycium ferocissimum]|uniref:uncharacterized protein LOC132039409 n=1 Tax=Lycium ferocissimum TaxID=112874 RepID=UPI0028152BD6|nr:uncharacterized protein LOC132039409 [Lycium ferocissimum]
MALLRKLKKKVRKVLVFFVKFAKRLIIMQKNVGTKDCSTTTGASKFREGKEEEKEENFSTLLNRCFKESNEWYVDSGCTNHMTGDEKAFLSFNRSITSKVRMGNGALVDAKGKGTISINRKGSGKQIHDVLYVPDLEENLLGVGQLMENGYSLVFRDNYCRIYDKIEPNQVIVEVKMIKRNFPLQLHYNALKMKL